MVPVDRQDYASEAEEWADLIADNRIAELAEIDDNLLAELLAELSDTDFDVDLTGYSEKQVNNLLADFKSVEVKDDNFDVLNVANEAKQNLRSKRGDIWQLGKHRLMCGDSTKIDDVRKLMNGEKASMVFTDPPYNVNYQGGSEDKLKIKNDNMPAAEFQKFLLSAFSCMYESVKPGTAIYVCHADTVGSDFRKAMTDSGWSIRQCLIWVKNQFVLGRQDYQWQHEPILYGWRPDGPHQFYGGRKQGTIIDNDSPVVIQDNQDGTSSICVQVGLEQVVLRGRDISVVSNVNDSLMSTWRFEKPVRNGEHPTMKPIPLCARAIQNSSKPYEIVADFFGGSGSTLMAAEQTGRVCYCMEYDPVYVDVIIRRWEEYTGQKAILLST